MKGLSARESVLEAKNLVKIDDTQPIDRDKEHPGEDEKGDIRTYSTRWRQTGERKSSGPRARKSMRAMEEVE